MIQRWDIITIGNLSRNRYWGERDDQAYRASAPVGNDAATSARSVQAPRSRATVPSGVGRSIL